MTKRMTPLAAFFAAAALVAACDQPEAVDPIWSDWETPAAGCDARTRIEIGDDYRGEGRVVFDDCSVCQVKLDVEALGDGEYELEVDGVDCQGTIDLDCVLYDDELECEDASGVRYELERN